MGDKKIILPAEVKVCATCTYWDGERSIDEDVQIVVVDEACHGECIVREKDLPALRCGVDDPDCLWENLDPDPASAEEPAEAAPRLKVAGKA